MRIKKTVLAIALLAVSVWAKDANDVFRAHEWSSKSGAVVQGGNGPSGKCVTSIGSGDYLLYNDVDFGDGRYDILMAVLAAPEASQGKTIEIRIDAGDGDLLGTLTIESTGGLDIFKEQYADIKSVSGVHAVYLVFPESPGADITWFVFGINPDNETEAQKDARMDWFREARFGQFIHWGAYSTLGGVYNGEQIGGNAEWIMFDRSSWDLRIPVEDYARDAAKPFNPIQFDAKEWVDLCEDAGQKYMVITAKHHDGFSMYDTDVNHFKDYDVVDFADYGKDPLAALSQECKSRGIPFCTYYSIMDWRHQDLYATEWGSDYPVKYVAEMKEQLMELIDRYDPELMWFDAGWASVLRDLWNSGEPDRLYKYLRVLKNSLIVNDRVGVHAGEGDGDYFTPEQGVPSDPQNSDWETCMTMNNSWGYKSWDTTWKSIWSLIQTMSRTSSRNGNWLLNIGPDGDGVTPEGSANLLRGIGTWLEVNGEGIYGTNGNPFDTLFMNNSGCTWRPGKLYFWNNKWPVDSIYRIPLFDNEIVRCYTLNDTTKSFPFTKNSSDITIKLPGRIPDNKGAMVVVEYTGDLRVAGDIVGAADPRVQIAQENLSDGKFSLQGSRIVFSIPESATSGDARLELYNGKGVLLGATALGIDATGPQSVSLNEMGARLSRGFYVCRLTTGSSTVTHSFVMP